MWNCGKFVIYNPGRLENYLFIPNIKYSLWGYIPIKGFLLFSNLFRVGHSQIDWNFSNGISELFEYLERAHGVSKGS